MKKYIFAGSWAFALLLPLISFSQIDLKKLDLEKIDLSLIVGKVIRVEKGFSPKFYLNDVKIPSVNKVGEILGIKQIDEVNKLFKTFKTGRTIYKVATYVGTAAAIYGVIKKVDNAASKKDYQSAFATAIGTVGSGIVVKLLTKQASYKAVDIFNKAAVKSIKDILNLGISSDGRGIGLYVKL